MFHLPVNANKSRRQNGRYTPKTSDPGFRFGSQWTPDPERAALTVCANPVRVLMRDGEWLVPESQRPTLAPPPKERKRNL